MILFTPWTWLDSNDIMELSRWGETWEVSMVVKNPGMGSLEVVLRSEWDGGGGDAAIWL